LLRTLPGVGPYTAAAIAAIAFDAPAAAVDANAERVVARLFAVKMPLPDAKTTIKALAKRLVPHTRPGDFAQAMMDLGATLCTPNRPACAVCPVAHFCRGLAAGCPGMLPRKTPRPERPLRQGALFFVAQEDGAVLVRTRPPKGLLGGMTEFPGTAWESEFNVDDALAHAPLAAAYRKLQSLISHSFTHFSLQLTIFAAEVPARMRAPKGCRFVPARDLDKEAFPSVMRKVFAEVRRGAASTPPSRCVRVLRGTRRVYE
jgi:A/G-specific adenine glycosylase